MTNKDIILESIAAFELRKTLIRQEFNQIREQIAKCNCFITHHRSTGKTWTDSIEVSRGIAAN